MLFKEAAVVVVGTVAALAHKLVEAAEVVRATLVV
jgi:hypothetical protein